MLPRGNAPRNRRTPLSSPVIRPPFALRRTARQVINCGWAGPMDLQLITGFDPWNFRHYQAYVALMEGLPESGPSRAVVWIDFPGLARPDMLDALNVKYIVASKRLPLPEDRYELAARFPDKPTFAFRDGLERKDVFVYRNRTCLPRVFFAERVLKAVDDRNMRERVGRADLRSTAVVLSAGHVPTAPAGDPQDRATVRAARAGRLTVGTSTANLRYWSSAKVWHPGWRATLDGKPVELLRTDMALNGAVGGCGSARGAVDVSAGLLAARSDGGMRLCRAAGDAAGHRRREGVGCVALQASTAAC